ncbi:MAG: MMPL family transporter [Tuberibacillus sp.]
MRLVLKAKWFILLAWVIVIAALMITQPNMSDLVHEKGQAFVPEGYSSSEAANILKKMNEQNGTGNSSSAALVFYDNKGLSDQDQKDIKIAIDRLNSQKDKLGITGITSVFDQPDLKEKLVSENGKTMLVNVNIKTKDKDTKQLTNDLYASIKDIKVNHYFTSDWMINNDTEDSMQSGLHKTEYLTVIFILLVLFIVFRSAIAPFIPLVAVGISFLVSQSIVAFLVKWFDFPLSNFTQIFLVAVLFGIGTDYCILLISRFKEELPKHETVNEAIITTFKHGGRTVFFSGLAVFIGFAAIGFSTFNIYQSAVGVAVGIAVMIMALITIVPFFMSVLGTKLFWPSRKAIGHSESHFWGSLGRFSLKRPLIAFIITAIVCIPFLFTYDGARSFNSMKEISDDYPSVKGFNIISDNFNAGEAMPTTIAIKNDERMDQREYLQTIEAINREVKKVDHVETVRSVTQPLGEPIKDFLVPSQAQTLDQGLKQANDGVKKIADGLGSASKQLKASAPQLEKATDGIDDLVTGTKDLKNGVITLQDGLTKIQKGIESGATGAGDIKNGLTQLKTNAENLLSSQQALLNGYTQMQKSLGEINKNYKTIQTGLTASITQARDGFASYASSHPEAGQDPTFQQSLGTLNGLLTGKGANQPSPLLAIQNIYNGMQNISGKMNEANAGFNKVVEGQKAFNTGLVKLIDAVDQLQSGLNQAAAGQGQAIGNIPSITGGLDKIAGGQTQFKDGFSGLNGQMEQLTKGLDDAVSGLNKVSGGLNDAGIFLNELSLTNSSLSGFYIPDQALEDKSFQESMNNYMSKDRKITKLDVVFDVNPYSETALNHVDDIKAAVERATKNTPLENAKVGIGGVSSIFNDLSHISGDDYSRTAMLMLIGIGIVLIILLRSFIMPIYIIGSLILTYFTSMGISEAIFVNWLGYSGINWAVPFFGFVIVIALGVDYSIFLMDRFNEHRDLPVREAILTAMKSMGTVILSAAIILGGTFAAMMPSGVVTLMEIATIIIMALILYTLIILPLLIPVLVRTFGKANWWPFKIGEQ